MVFSSLEFILVFLPLAYAGFLLVHRVAGWRGVFPYLALVSLVFYGQWSLILLGILLGSVVGNYLVATLLIGLRERRRAAGLVLVGGILANLGALGWFKYANFFIEAVNGAAGTGWSALDIILPVGISFFTFIQIGYLVEAYSGRAERPAFHKYVLFATFFPCVTAGPLVLQREIFDQLKADRADRAFTPTRLAVGLTLFCIGLAKKVLFADAIAPYANVAFDGVAAGAAIDLVNAWAGSLAYALQLYFDFSGYCDMAIGLGVLFGIRLPLNFNSPFKATSITDFWRRWHMTMTRFFTTYVYTPLAMKNARKAAQRRWGRGHRFLMTAAIPVIVTFLVAGTWHGAGWTFVVYGLIHGVALAVNHGWREFRGPRLARPLGWTLTMAVVVSGLVVFRSPDMATALTMLASMWGLAALGGAEAAGAVVQLDLQQAALLIAAFGAVVLTLPNSQEILRDHWVSSDPKSEGAERLPAWLAWRASPGWAVAVGIALVVAVTSVGSTSTFLYYQF